MFSSRAVNAFQPSPDKSPDRPNEKKISDGGRGRATIGVGVWKPSQEWSERRTAVRSIAWLGVAVLSFLTAYFEKSRTEECKRIPAITRPFWMFFRRGHLDIRSMSHESKRLQVLKIHANAVWVSELLLWKRRQ